MVVWSEHSNSREHRARNRSSCHVCSKKPSEGATEEEDRGLLLVDFVLLYCLEDKKPLVAVHILLILDDSSVSIRLTETSLINRENFVIVVSEALGERGSLLSV